MQVPADKSRVVHFGVFEVDLQEAELRKSGIRIKLQEQPFQILTMLLERPGQTVTREELQRQFWPANTWVDVDHSLNASIKKLREALGDDSENPRFIETLHRRGYRFIAPVDNARAPAIERSAPSTPAAGRGLWKVLVPAAVLVAAAIGGAFYFRSRHTTTRLSDKDTVVLSDFDNKTGDSVFDDTLRQGLSVQLEQSPFLDLLSDRKVNDTLKLMGRSPEDRLTANISREVCQRTGSKAVLTGSIVELGSQYVIGLKATDCNTGEVLAETQEQAAAKEAVLKVLDHAAVTLRSKLGESLSSVQKFDTPLEQATTRSLEALQAFSLGYKMVGKGDDAASVPFFQKAIKLDPNFAMAYAFLGSRYYWDSGDTTLASENTRKAFELRANASERERLEIEATYNSIATGDLLKAQQVCEVWAQTYPRDWEAPNFLGTIYDDLGQPDKALAEYDQALRLYPDSGLILGNIVFDYFALNRIDEARATTDKINAKKLDVLFDNSYLLAFLQKDRAGMEQQVASAAGKAGLEDQLLGDEADTAAYSGELEKARDFSCQAVASAERAEKMAAAARYEADAALRESLFGYAGEARQQAMSALRHSNARDVQYVAALALALAGDTARAQALEKELGKRFPESTIVQFRELPTLHAQLALNRNDAPKAIAAVQAAAPYELSAGLYPAYFRGLAYLAAHQGSEAAAEFQKILDHRGIVLNSPIGALAHLGLARAYAMQRDTGKAKAAYQGFLALWKDADPDVPILKEAKAEYAKLQ